MHRTFISTIAGLSIALTAVASTPARSDNADVGRAIATIAGIAILGAIIKKATEDDDKVQTVTTPHTNRREPWVVQPRPLPPRARAAQNQRLLPQQCLRTFQGRRGTVQGFGAGCLDYNYKYANNLPSNCERVVTRNGRYRTIYSAHCLRREGYRLARR